MVLRPNYIRKLFFLAYRLQLRTYAMSTGSHIAVKAREDKLSVKAESPPQSEPHSLPHTEVPINNSDAGDTDHIQRRLYDYCDTDKSAADKLQSNENPREKIIKKLHQKKVASSLKRKSEKGFTKETFAQSDFYFENGLRKVYPYWFTFTSFAKRRWVGRTILDIYSSEFRGDDEDHEAALQTGDISVNGESKGSDYVVKDNDFITNTMHRHENPVCDKPIEILHLDDDLLVINKPSSIPCHPCGKYRFNSILFILGKELGLDQLRNLYRLDRLTSGILMMGRSNKATQCLEKQIRERQVEKEYVCRVVGDFPEGSLEVDQPLGCISHKLCLFRVDTNGKPSRTMFKKLSYNGKSSVVLCKPHTGRTHQIRVHLQYLGHPIVNDPLYNTDAWGPSRCKGGVLDKSLKELEEAIRTEHHVGRYYDTDDPDKKEYNKAQVSVSTETTDEPKILASGDKYVARTSVCTKNPVVERYLKENKFINQGVVNCHKKIKLDISEDSTSHMLNSASTEVDINSANCDEMLTPITDNMENVNNELKRCTDKAVDNVNSSTGSDFKPYDTNSEDKFCTDESEKISDCGASAFQFCKPIIEVTAHCFDATKWTKDDNCCMCNRHYVNPKPRDLIMYLHALRYKGPDWEYSTDMPDWANDDWTFD